VRPIYIGQAYCYPPDVAFYIFLSANISTEYLKHAAHSPFFSSKCSLFHNATFFGSCIIHILHTGCAKNLNVKLRCQKINIEKCSVIIFLSASARVYFVYVAHSSTWPIYKSISYWIFLGIT